MRKSRYRKSSRLLRDMIECFFFFFGERLLLLCQLFFIIHYYVDYSTLQLVKLLIRDVIFSFLES